jgi:hemerythrin superfamily protein
MDIYEVLHREHEQVSQLFQQIEGLSHGASRTRSRLFGELRTALEHHSRAEEKVFYPELRKYDASHFLALEAAEEHHVVDLLLKELSRMDSDKEEWLAKLTVLKEEVLHHVAQEENELFPKAREFIDDSQASEMATRFEAQKKRLH